MFVSSYNTYVHNNSSERVQKEKEVLTEAYKDIIDTEITEESIPEFKALRMLIVKNRTRGLKVWHKTNKAYFLNPIHYLYPNLNNGFISSSSWYIPSN